jgi:hypothetical protein
MLRKQDDIETDSEEHAIVPEFRMKLKVLSIMLYNIQQNIYNNKQEDSR